MLYIYIYIKTPIRCRANMIKKTYWPMLNSSCHVQTNLSVKKGCYLRYYHT